MIAVMETSAIVEIMRGTEAGRKALEALGEVDIGVIPAVVLAELMSYAPQKRHRPQVRARS
jgi:predicted nucleic acid-binding protein